MLSLFLTLLSCTALKLADPVSLRDVNEENVSLQSWCVGVGCVMPFTPATCLSWCDWNFDKQADAEARGAFRSEAYGKKNQVAATAFNMVFAAVDGTDCDADKTATERFMDPKTKIGVGDKTDPGPYGFNHVPIYPDGDKESKSGDTYLKCKHCYIVQDGKNKNDIAPGRAQFSVLFTAGNNGGSKMELFQHDNSDQCGAGATKLYDIELPKFTAGKVVKGKWVSAGGACTVRSFNDIDGAKKKKAALDKCAATLVTCLKTADNASKKKVCNDAKTKCDKTENDLKRHLKDMGFGLTGSLAWPTCA